MASHNRDQLGLFLWAPCHAHKLLAPWGPRLSSSCLRMDRFSATLNPGAYWERVPKVPSEAKHEHRCRRGCMMRHKRSACGLDQPCQIRSSPRNFDSNASVLSMQRRIPLAHVDADARALGK